MGNPWTLLSSLPFSKRGNTSPHDKTASAQEQPIAPQTDRLQGVGRETELVRERVARLGMRLDDLQTLKDDLLHLSAPLENFIVEHSLAQRRLVEMEALLLREGELRRVARSELTVAERNASQAAHDLHVATNKMNAQEALVSQNEAALEHYRLSLEEKTFLADSLDQELFSANERSRSLTAENQTVRIEAEELGRSLALQSRQLAELSELSAMREEENIKLLQTVEGQSERLADLNSRLSDVGQKFETEKIELATVQTKLLSEQQARQKALELREDDRSAFQKEISALQLRTGGLTNRLSSTEKILAHTREQLAHHTEALREADKTSKDAIAAKSETERQLALKEEASIRQAAMVRELQRMNGDLRDRCEMLTRAMAAKEASVETSRAKAASLETRVEQITQRYEDERSALETAYRRTMEELQNERAERQLAQGALDIARSGRSKLLSDISALKRRTDRAGFSNPNEGLSESLLKETAYSAATDNVRPFKASGLEDEDK